jgi:hypothetical protein
MNVFDGLLLEGRAALLGLTPRQYVALGQSDARIFAGLPTAGALARLKRWLAAGSPDPDFSRLLYRGSDWARDIVLGVIRRAPTPVAWHAIEFVAWREVGSTAAGWMGSAMIARVPEGDRAHEIEICGHTDAESLASVCAHELGHSWSKFVSPPIAEVSMSDREWAARAVIASQEPEQTIEETIEQVVKIRVVDERIADELATAWGYLRYTDEARLRRIFTGEHVDAAAELAKQIDQPKAIERIAAAIEGDKS